MLGPASPSTLISHSAYPGHANRVRGPIQQESFLNDLACSFYPLRLMTGAQDLPCRVGRIGRSVSLEGNRGNQ